MLGEDDERIVRWDELAKNASRAAEETGVTLPRRTDAAQSVAQVARQFQHHLNRMGLDFSKVEAEYMLVLNARRNLYSPGHLYLSLSIYLSLFLCL